MKIPDGVLDECARTVYRIALVKTKNEDLAQDIVQSVFVTLFEKKPQFPDYPMFMIDLVNPPKIRDGKQYLPLKKAHLFDKESGIYGLDFSHGSTGMISLGNGMWYFSKDGKSDKGYYSEIVLCAYDEEDGFYEL